MAIIEPQMVAPVVDDSRSYMDWPAIFAGTVVATAISLVLLAFGSAIGLSSISAFKGEGISFVAFAVAAALWLLWVQISSFTAGGYLTGRMRRRHGDATEHESDIRDGSHGLTVWALGTLVGAVIAFSGVSGALTTATSAISSIGSAAGSAATTAASSVIDSNGLMIDRLLRSAAPANGAAPAPANAAAPNAAQPAPGQDDSRAEITRVLMGAIKDGKLEDADKQYLVNTVAQKAGISSEEATKRIDDLYAQAQKLEADARLAAERARKIAMIAAFITAASLFISAAAAYFGATLGGNHRDKQTVFADWNRIS